MNGKFLLDTNIVIGLFGSDPGIIARMPHSDKISIPCIVIGELCYGVNKSLRPKENLERVEDFAHRNTVLGCDETTGKIYGSIKDGLRRKGRPIPENDIWIAAIALQYDLILVTRDEHFQGIGQLKMEKW